MEKVNSALSDIQASLDASFFERGMQAGIYYALPLGAVSGLSGLFCPLKEMGEIVASVGIIGFGIGFLTSRSFFERLKKKQLKRKEYLEREKIKLRECTIM